MAADDALAECLESLGAQTFQDFEIVVVDNSGRGAVRSAGTAERVGARVIEMKRNVGFGAAINAAWAGSGATYFATLNDDAVASPGWLAALVAAGESFAAAGMFASRVLLAGKENLDSAGMLLCADGSSKQRGHGERAERFEEACEVLLPSGSAALYRGAMLRQTGGFDGDFFLYCEDTDLGLRGQRAGWACQYVPAAIVRHRYSHSAGRVSSLKAYYVERNRLFLCVKNLPLGMLLASPFVALVRYGWHLAYLFQGKGAAAQFTVESGAGWRLPLLVLQAHAALLMNLPRLLRQRRALFASARVSAGPFAKLLRRHSLSPRQLAQL